MEKVIAQFIGTLAIIITAYALQLNKKNKILVCQIISNTLYLIQYFLLDALTASGASLISIFRGSILFYYDKTNKKKSKLILLCIILAIFIMTILTYKDYFSIIAFFASFLYTLGIWQNNLKLFRKIALITPILWFIYNIHVSAYISIFASCMEFISAVIAIYRLDIKKSK